MQPDTAVVRFLTEHAGEHGALPLPVLLLILAGMFGLGALTVWKLGNLKTYLGEPPFPTHAATVLAAVVGFLVIVTIAACRLALGMEWPGGYDMVINMVIAFALGVAGWGIGKRLTSSEAYEGKAKVEAAKSGAGVPPDMKTTTEQRAPGVSRTTDSHPVTVVVPAKPAFGGKSR
jgi:hypothetical protein